MNMNNQAWVKTAKQPWESWPSQPSESGGDYWIIVELLRGYTEDENARVASFFQVVMLAEWNPYYHQFTSFEYGSTRDGDNIVPSSEITHFMPAAIPARPAQD